MPQSKYIGNSKKKSVGAKKKEMLKTFYPRLRQLMRGAATLCWTTTTTEMESIKRWAQGPVRSQSTLSLPLSLFFHHNHYTTCKMSSSNSIQAQQFLPRSCSLTTLIFLVVMAVLAVYVTGSQADGGDVMSGGEGGEMTAMADAIKYLQGLDKVYGQAARPRYN